MQLAKQGKRVNMSEEIFEKVKKIVAEQLGVEEDQVKPEASFRPTI